MTAYVPVESGVDEEIVRTLVAIDNAAERSQRFALALHVGVASVGILALAVLFSLLSGPMPWLVQAADGPSSGRDWLILVPLGVICLLLFSAYKRDRELRSAEGDFLVESISALRGARGG